MVCALLPPEYQVGGDSKREKLCQPDLQKITITATGASSYGRLEARRDPFNAGEGKAYPQTNTDGEPYTRKFDDPTKSFEPQHQKEQEFFTMVLHSIWTKFWKDPTGLRYFPLKRAVWSQFTSGCSWASFWLSKDDEDFQRVAMNQSFPRTQDLTQTLQ